METTLLHRTSSLLRELSCEEPPAPRDPEPTERALENRGVESRRFSRANMCADLAIADALHGADRLDIQSGSMIPPDVEEKRATIRNCHERLQNLQLDVARKHQELQRSSCRYNDEHAQLKKSLEDMQRLAATQNDASEQLSTAQKKKQMERQQLQAEEERLKLELKEKERTTLPKLRRDYADVSSRHKEVVRKCETVDNALNLYLADFTRKFGCGLSLESIGEIQEGNDQGIGASYCGDVAIRGDDVEPLGGISDRYGKLKAAIGNATNVALPSLQKELQCCVAASCIVPTDTEEGHCFWLRDGNRDVKDECCRQLRVKFDNCDRVSEASSFDPLSGRCKDVHSVAGRQRSAAGLKRNPHNSCAVLTVGRASALLEGWVSECL